MHYIAGHRKDNAMLLTKLDGSGTILIDAVDSRLKVACEYEAKGRYYLSSIIFGNALEADKSLAERKREAYLSRVNS